MFDITVISSSQRGVRLFFFIKDDWLNSQEIDYRLDQKIQGQFQNTTCRN